MTTELLKQARDVICEAFWNNHTEDFDDHVELIDKLNAALAQPADEDARLVENKLLRKMLFFRCCGMSGYHDDGELQDASVLPAIDFKRDTAGDIELKLIARGMTELASAPKGGA